MKLKTMHRTRKHIIIYLLFMFSVSVFGQEEWKVPSENKEKLSTFEFNSVTEQKGQNIFENNCKACHGNPGMNNFQPLSPEPGDPAGSKFQKNTDGELFYKISEGRGQMLSFKQTLSPDEIWNVISYIRSFHKDYVQQVAKELEKKGYDGDIEFLLTYLKDDEQIKLTLTGIKNNQQEKLTGVDLQIYAERRFGILPLDDIKTTNSEGNAYFTLPGSLPGDSAGNIRLIAQLTDVELFGKTSYDTIMAVGLPMNRPALNANRAVWNKFRKAPLWMMFSYFTGVLIAWGVIFYILFQLRTIFFLGKEESTAK